MIAQPGVRQTSTGIRGGVVVLQRISGEDGHRALVGLVNGGRDIALIHLDAQAVLFSVDCSKCFGKPFAAGVSFW